MNDRDKLKRKLLGYSSCLCLLPLVPRLSIAGSKSEISNDLFFNGGDATSVLGDSISHGAWAGDVYTNGWVRLLARALNGEYGTYSYGFTPLVSSISKEHDGEVVHQLRLKVNGIN